MTDLCREAAPAGMARSEINVAHAARSNALRKGEIGQFARPIRRVELAGGRLDDIQGGLPCATQKLRAEPPSRSYSIQYCNIWQDVAEHRLSLAARGPGIAGG
jgi:hypothetical protein